MEILNLLHGIEIVKGTDSMREASRVAGWLIRVYGDEKANRRLIQQATIEKKASRNISRRPEVQRPWD